MATVIESEQTVAAATEVDVAESPQETLTENRNPHISEVYDDVPLDIKVCMTLAVAVPLLGTIGASVLLWQYGWMGWQYVAMLVGGWVVTEFFVSWDAAPWARSMKPNKFRWIVS